MAEEVSFKKRKNRGAANERKSGAALAAAAATPDPEPIATPTPAPPAPAAADTIGEEVKEKKGSGSGGGGGDAPTTFYFAKRTVTIEDADEDDDDEAEIKRAARSSQDGGGGGDGDDDAQQWEVPGDADEDAAGGDEEAAAGGSKSAAGSKRKLDGGDEERIEGGSSDATSSGADGGAASTIARGREAIRARLQSKRQKKDNPLAASTRARLKKVDDEVGVASKRTVLPDRSTQDHMIAVEISQAPKVKEGKPKWTGPLKQAENTRAISRFDYQPDLCKDWKDTGYCGFGDSCKFMHDRTDYKSGWQLEKEWKEQEDIKRKRAMGEYVEDEADYRVDQEEAMPFACLICRKDFVNPVVTKCKHYFCERCALQHYAKDTKCAQCAEQTHGIFNTATKLIAHLKKTKAKPKEKKAPEDEEAPRPGGGHASGRRTTEGWSMP